MFQKGLFEGHPTHITPGAGCGVSLPPSGHEGHIIIHHQVQEPRVTEKFIHTTEQKSTQERWQPPWVQLWCPHLAWVFPSSQNSCVLRDHLPATIELPLFLCLRDSQDTDRYSHTPIVTDCQRYSRPTDPRNTFLSSIYYEDISRLKWEEPTPNPEVPPPGSWDSPIPIPISSGNILGCFSKNTFLDGEGKSCLFSFIGCLIFFK